MDITGSLTCFIVKRSLSVTVLSLMVSKSTVIAKGIPHSSVLAYLLPIETPESSILDETPALVKLVSIFKLFKDQSFTDDLNDISKLIVCNKWKN